MSQHDLTIANQGFPAFRADLNDALQALGSCQSGTSAPSPTFANQLWYDTTNNILKIRNEDNDAWISIATLDQTADSISAITATTLNGSIVNAGALNATGNTVLGDASTDTLNVGNGGIVKDAEGNTGIGASPVIGYGKLQVKNGFLYVNEDGANTKSIYIRSNVAGIPTIQVVTNDALAFTTNNIERMRINASAPILCLAGGNTSATGTGIAFPAAQNASSDANTLDDYEEGSWTPTNSQGVSLGISANTYLKIGNTVYLNTFLDVGSNSNGSAFLITGLPFYRSGQSSSVGCFNSNNEDLYAYMDTTGISIRTSGNISKTNAQLSGKFIAFQIFYNI